MLLPIDDSRTAGEICDRFNECFPFLKIELYSNKRNFKHGIKIPETAVISTFRKKHDPGILEIRSKNKISNILHQLRTGYGLEAAVYRLQDEKWILLTDDENLSIQEAGEMANS